MQSTTLQSNYIDAQHTGMLPIITQHMQPASIMPIMQSQQHEIIDAIFMSPLMHLKVTPISVISQVVDAIIMLQVQHAIPFIIITQPHMLPAIIWHMLCIILAAISSSHVHIIIMPPSIFAIFMVQRGIIIMPGIIPEVMFAGIIEPPAIAVPPAIIPRSIIIVSMIILLGLCDCRKPRRIDLREVVYLAEETNINGFSNIL